MISLLELADINESHVILVSDIELVIDENNEHIERVEAYLDMVEKAFINYCYRHSKASFDDLEDICK